MEDVAGYVRYADGAPLCHENLSHRSSFLSLTTTEIYRNLMDGAAAIVSPRTDASMNACLSKRDELGHDATIVVALATRFERSLC